MNSQARGIAYNAIRVLDEFDEWLHEEYEKSGDDETILHIIVTLDEIRKKYFVQVSD
jgi:hypothetical protein